MTRTLTIDPLNINSSLISQAAETIVKGGLVAFPTETVYGLGADVYNEKAVAKIFKAKGRGTNRPLAVCIADTDQLLQLVGFVPPEAEAIIGNYLPGPVTLIFPKKPVVSPAVTADLNSVGIRYPDCGIALALIKVAGVPIATTSANISGKANPTTAQEVLAQLSGKIDLLIDGGATELKMVSTIIDFTSSPYKIVRPGALSKQELDHFLQQKGFLSLSA